MSSVNCACRFDENDVPISECRHHADQRREVESLRAEVERLRGLAGRYVAWIAECEGITYLTRRGAPFTESEIVELDGYCDNEQQGEKNGSDTP